MKMTLSSSANFFRVLSFALSVLFIPLASFAQQQSVEADSLKVNGGASTYIGFSPGVGFFRTSSSGGVPGASFHRANFNGGIAILSGDVDNFTFKSGVEFNFFRSSYLNDTSYYEEFMTIPFLFQVASFDKKSGNEFFTLHIGPAISLSAGNGYAKSFDSFYNKVNLGFLDYAKVSGLAEFAVYSKRKHGLNALGMRLSTDLVVGEARKGSEINPQSYFMATIFASILFGN